MVDRCALCLANDASSSRFRNGGYPDGISEELKQQLASQYVELFTLFLENSEIIEGVSIFGIRTTGKAG